MNRVYQTLFGERVGTPTSGNSYPACLASLLELPLDRVPHFYGEMTPIEVETKSFDLVNRRVTDWLKTRGYRVLGFDWPMNGAAHRYLAGALAVFSGKSPRGNFSHCVIGRIGDDSGEWSPVFDPRRTNGDSEFLGAEPYMVEVLFTTPGDAGILGETVVEMVQRRGLAKIEVVAGTDVSPAANFCPHCVNGIAPMSDQPCRHCTPMLEEPLVGLGDEDPR